MPQGDQNKRDIESANLSQTIKNRDSKQQFEPIGNDQGNANHPNRDKIRLSRLTKLAQKLKQIAYSVKIKYREESKITNCRVNAIR